MIPEQILATLALLLAGEPDAAFDPLRSGGYDERYPVTVEACPRPLPPLDVEGQTLICGRIAVPEDHNAAQADTVPLAFALLKARSLSPAADPVIYLHGGPGGYTVQDIPFNAATFAFLRERRDIIIPTLALAGLKDTQTNPSAAETVVRTLGNGQAFTFPEAGHGVIMFSQCARDIAVAFIDNPTGKVNGGCIEDLKPKFYVPKAVEK